jgi:hypothetical protein
LRIIAVAVAAIAGACDLAACGSFGTDPRPNADAGTAEAGTDSSEIKLPTSDAAFDDAPFVVGDGGTADGTCFSFLQSAEGFQLAGAAKIVVGQGLSLNIKKVGAATATRSFVAPSPIARSIVKLTGVLQIEASSWGSLDSDYVGLLAQYYGFATTSDQAPTTSFSLARGATNPDLEVTTWHAAKSYDGFDPIGHIVAGELNGKVTTNWAVDGNVTVNTPALTVTVKARTLSGAKGQAFTLVLGGTSKGNVPDVEYLVKEVCVAFQ